MQTSSKKIDGTNENIPWENGWHFVTPPLVSLWNEVWTTRVEITYWWRITTHERLRPVQEFTAGVKIPRPFAFLAVRHKAICGKIIDYISGHKQFDVASAISNFKKILSKNISPFGTVKTESENIWICWRWLYKKQQNKEHKQDAALLIGVNLLQQYNIRKY